MEVIPVINCSDFKCVKRRLKKISQLPSSWAHIDVADGDFTRSITWQEPDDLINYKRRFSWGVFFARFFGSKRQATEINLEVHLMVRNPEMVIDGWIRAGAKRVIVHLEAMADGWFRVIERCRSAGVEVTAAIEPETPLQNLLLLLRRFEINYVQVLAVKPGPPGQKFNPAVLEKIKTLRKEEPNLRIEVDGGINLETAKLAKEAGADIITSSAFIWGSLNHAKAFAKLKSI